MPVFLRSKMAAGWTQTVLTMDEKRSTRTRSKAAEDSRRDAFTSVIYTVVFLMSNIALRIGTAWYVRKTKLHLFFAWMQSCFVLILMWKRRRPFRYDKSILLFKFACKRGLCFSSSGWVTFLVGDPISV